MDKANYPFREKCTEYCLDTKVEPEIFCQDYTQILLRFVKIFLQSKYFVGEMMFAKLLKQFA